MTTQNVWRTVSAPNHNGVFVWEAIEFVPYADMTKPTSKQFIELRDGTFIDVWCSHFFTEERATNYLNDEYSHSDAYGIVYHDI
jgi:hypothetical protein